MLNIIADIIKPKAWQRTEILGLGSEEEKIESEQEVPFFEDKGSLDD